MCVASPGSAACLVGLLVSRQRLPVSWAWWVGSACSPLPVPVVPALQACHSCWPSPGSVLAQACAGCLRKPSSFARQSKESFLFGSEASSLTDSPSRVPFCQPSWTCSSCLCALSAACPGPAYWALWVPPSRPLRGPSRQPEWAFPLLWSTRALSRPCGSPLSSWSMQEQAGEAHGLVGRAQRTTGRRSRPPETAGDCPRWLSWFQSLTEALKLPFLCSLYHLSLWVQ